MDIVIVGMPRCGSFSLHQWLINAVGKEAKIFRDECIFKNNAIGYFKARWPDARPAIIFRNPIDRCWSWYHYMKPEMSYYEFLITPKNNPGFGELNPIKQSNIKKWITPWLELNPLFYSFEQCSKWDDFPNINKSKDKTEISQYNRDITRDLLRKEL